MDTSADHELGPSPSTLLEAHQVVVDSSQASADTTVYMTSLSAENEIKTSSQNSILEVGDLVTVSERSDPGKLRRDAGTGRVVQVIAVPEDKLLPGEHPYLYDVKYIVGGKHSSVLRSDLTYTTLLSSVRKKPSATIAPDTMKENRENKSNRISSERRKSWSGLSEENDVNKSNSSTSNTVQTSDLYDRQRKELEKALLKLENTDRRGFFDIEGGEENSVVQELREHDYISPPTSWSEIRRRVISDYYVLDRVSELYKKKHELMAPYLNWRQCEGICPAPPVTTDEIRFRTAVHWELFCKDVVGMCETTVAKIRDDNVMESDMILNTANKILSVVNDLFVRTGQRQEAEMSMTEFKYRFSDILRLSNNREPAMQSEWRKTPYPERLYQRLATSNVLCDGLLPVDQRSAMYELETTLSDRFVGQSYTYDDNGQSESWMKSVISEKSPRQKKRRSNDEDKVAAYMQEDARMVKAQVRTCMEKLLISVTDRVMTELGVLQKPEVRSVNWQDGDIRTLKHRSNNSHTTKSSMMEDEIHIKNASFDCSESSLSSTALSPEVIEQPVWGIDCYTRKNIEACIEADFDSYVAIDFIEKWLLPAINACPEEFAYDMSRAARILEGLSPFESSNFGIGTESKMTDETHHSLVLNAFQEKLLKTAPPWLRSVAHHFRVAVESIGGHEFCVHPKGHGSVVICSEGIPANTLVTHYRGEVYPPWRWGEKLDAIEETQRKFNLKKNLPDFYNFCLERPQNDPRGYGILFVDASRKAGLGSSFSHSCNPTCEVKVVAVHGKLSLAITTLRKVDVGEELTFDYNGVTESLDEYRAAICLCGHKVCRGSFLHFATADCYQVVMRQDFPLAARFAGLAKSCNKRNLSADDKKRLMAHGFKTASFGAVSISYQSPGVFDDITLHKPTESLDNVPVWLLTFAAETLQYIEYERRKLPIALVLRYISEKEKSQQEDSVQEASKRKRQALMTNSSALKSINLEDTDAEGWSSMEQRIHQLVQTLSRVGRVLGRHRESLSHVSVSSSNVDITQNLNDLHHPIAIVPDDKVVDYLWCNEDGLWQSAKRFIDYMPIRADFETIEAKYNKLYEPPYSHPAEARNMLSSALLEMRQRLMSHLNLTRESTRFSTQEKKKIRKIQRSKTQVHRTGQSAEDQHLEEKSDESSLFDTFVIDKLEATCDLFLLYAKTTTFFEIKPFISFSSSPIDIYARELGSDTAQNSSVLNALGPEAAHASSEYKIENISEPSAEAQCSGDSCGIESKKLSSLDEVVARLTVEYKGDYVISLLLQWFSGGISLSPGLPDMSGCIHLPSIRNLWGKTEDLDRLRQDKNSFPPQYDIKIRPLLLSCMEDIQRRGDPWPYAVKKFFLPNERAENINFVGSPVLDFFITGDDAILLQIVSELRAGSLNVVRGDETKMCTTETHSLQADKEGAPTQAVSNWVQCENSDCMKWRKLPWYINLDDLPENFLCSNNIWNPRSSSCESAEDSWDDLDAPLPAGNNNIPETAFVKGARFDVQRKGNRLFTEAVVVAMDTSTAEKRVMFHFLRVSKDLDEWLDIRSSRIAPHKSYVR